MFYSVDALPALSTPNSDLEYKAPRDVALGCAADGGHGGAAGVPAAAAECQGAVVRVQHRAGAGLYSFG